MDSFSSAPPDIQPPQKSSVSALTPTGSASEVADALPFGIYGDPASPLYDENFISGAVDQVKFTYNKHGGNVLDIELTADNVYAAYEEAVLEYSYIINMHQAENMITNALGDTTGTFDHDGNLKAGVLKNQLSGSQVNLKYPQFTYAQSNRIAKETETRVGTGGIRTEYSASIDVNIAEQDYDLQEIISNKPEFSASIGNKRVQITKVFYETPRAAWRFYGYYGGLTTVGNYHNYGQWSDDSTFEIIPVWQNKLQSIQYETALYTRISHWSYELKGNNLRIYPAPDVIGPRRIWVRFRIPEDSWSQGEFDNGVDGINNINTLPFENIPYENINMMGKNWIRDYAYALTLETLGNIRSKFASIPIPGESVQLNGSDLISRGKEEQNRLRDQLKETLDRNRYQDIVEREADMAEDAKRAQDNLPMAIHVG